jgi:hypothetical protein
MLGPSRVKHDQMHWDHPTLFAGPSHRHFGRVSLHGIKRLRSRYVNRIAPVGYSARQRKLSEALIRNAFLT